MRGELSSFAEPSTAAAWLQASATAAVGKATSPDPATGKMKTTMPRAGHREGRAKPHRRQVEDRLLRPVPQAETAGEGPDALPQQSQGSRCGGVSQCRTAGKRP